MERSALREGSVLARSAYRADPQSLREGTRPHERDVRHRDRRRTDRLLLLHGSDEGARPARDSVREVPPGDDQVRRLGPDLQDGRRAEDPHPGRAQAAGHGPDRLRGVPRDRQAHSDRGPVPGSEQVRLGRLRVRLRRVQPLPRQPVPGPRQALGRGPSDHQRHPALRGAAPARGDVGDRDAAAGDRAAGGRDGLGQVDDDRLDDRLHQRASRCTS